MATWRVWGGAFAAVLALGALGCEDNNDGDAGITSDLSANAVDMATQAVHDLAAAAPDLSAAADGGVDMAAARDLSVTVDAAADAGVQDAAAGDLAQGG